MSKVFIAFDLLEVQNRRRAGARLLDNRLQVNAALYSGQTLVRRQQPERLECWLLSVWSAPSTKRWSWNGESSPRTARRHRFRPGRSRRADCWRRKRSAARAPGGGAGELVRRILAEPCPATHRGDRIPSPWWLGLEVGCI